MKNGFDFSHPFSPFQDGKANGFTFMIMQSDKNYNKMKELHKQNPFMSFQQALNILGLDKSDFVESDYKKTKSIFLR